jgi:hypothetical protein
MKALSMRIHLGTLGIGQPAHSTVVLFHFYFIYGNFVEFTVNFPYAIAKSNFPQ